MQNLRRITKVVPNDGDTRFIDIGTEKHIASNFFVDEEMKGCKHVLIARRPFKDAQPFKFKLDSCNDYSLVNGKRTWTLSGMNTFEYICGLVARKYLGVGKNAKQFTLWVRKVK